MANLKAIRKRIVSVKSTQKITRAMKMVAAARLTRAQTRILSLRPYAVKTGEVLREVVEAAGQSTEHEHPLLAARPDKSTLLLVITSDRGLCGAFNTNINKAAERAWKAGDADGVKVQVATIGRKGRDYFRRRKAPVFHVFAGVWDRLDIEAARGVAKKILVPFLAGEVDSIQLVYNEFKSAMTQRVVSEPLLPIRRAMDADPEQKDQFVETRQFIFEPDQAALLERLVPMYVEITILRALYESMASEFGARMTAMDSATKNAAEMISKLTLKYNRARQAAITTELMEVIGGAEALSG